MKKKQSTLSQSAYFSGLSSGNLPRSRNLEPSYDIISWYVQWKDRDPAVKACAHSVTDSPSNSIKDVEVVYSPQPIPYLTDFFKIARFVLWGVNAILFSGFMALCGRWGGAFLLKEAAMAVTVRLLPSATLAHDYLFHNSAWIYRPLWTYEAKRKGSRIIFYFYSTNCETFKRSSGYPFQENFWHLVDWPLFLAWDEHQAEFLRREVQSPADIRVVGPVWFSDHSVPVPNLPRNTVAIFDVQPFREAWYRCYCLPVEYYTPAICTRFLEDVSCELNRMKYFPVLKKKRDIGNLAHPKYRYAVSLLKEQRALTLVDANVSAIQLIKRCVAVISMPFTSTALLGRDLGIPSVYYDPFGDVQKDDRAAHGIPVLLAKEELRDWLATLKDPARK